MGIGVVIAAIIVAIIIAFVVMYVVGVFDSAKTSASGTDTAIAPTAGVSPAIVAPETAPSVIAPSVAPISTEAPTVTPTVAPSVAPPPVVSPPVVIAPAAPTIPPAETNPYIMPKAPIAPAEPPAVAIKYISQPAPQPSTVVKPTSGPVVQPTPVKTVDPLPAQPALSALLGIPYTSAAGRKYEHYPDYVSDSYDLKYDSSVAFKDRATLLARCDKEPGCLGIVASGYLKKTIRPMDQWVRSDAGGKRGMYVLASAVKRTPSVLDRSKVVTSTYKAADGKTYKFIPGVESRGGELKFVPTKTPAALSAACSATPGCIGFNTWGWLKGSLLRPESSWRNASTNTAKGLYVSTTYK